MPDVPVQKGIGSDKTSPLAFDVALQPVRTAAHRGYIVEGCVALGVDQFTVACEPVRSIQPGCIEDVASLEHDYSAHVETRLVHALERMGDLNLK